MQNNEMIIQHIDYIRAALEELPDVEVNHILIMGDDYSITLRAGELEKILHDGEKVHVNGNLSFVWRCGTRVCQYS